MGKEDTLSKQEREKLELQLTTAFETVQSISDELTNAKQLGEYAKTKAEGVKSGVFHRKQAIEDLKDATIMNAVGNITTLEVVEKVSENQQKLAYACQEFVKLGMVDLASNRAVVEYIKNVMSGGSDKTLNEETIEQLKGVISDLKQKEDLLLKQRKQGEKINEHEKRIRNIESRTEDIDEEIEHSKEYDQRQDEAIESQRKKGVERDKRLDAGDAHDKKQDVEIDKLHKKNVEQDERLIAGDKYDKLQDERMQKGEEKDAEQDRLLDIQKETDARHDETLAIHTDQIAELERQISALEKDIAILKDGRRMRLYIGVCGALGIIGIIIGIINLIL